MYFLVSRGCCILQARYLQVGMNQPADIIQVYKCMNFCRGSRGQQFGSSSFFLSGRRLVSPVFLPLGGPTTAARRVETSFIPLPYCDMGTKHGLGIHDPWHRERSFFLSRYAAVHCRLCLGVLCGGCGESRSSSFEVHDGSSGRRCLRWGTGLVGGTSL